MSTMTVLSQIPALSSGNLSELIQGVLQAAVKGVKVLVTSSILNELKPLFDELGVEVREVDNVETYDTYILIKGFGIQVKIEVVEAGRPLNTVKTTLKALEKTLKEIIEKRKGNKEGPKYYEIVLPDEIKQIITNVAEEEEPDDAGAEEL